MSVVAASAGGSGGASTGDVLLKLNPSKFGVLQREAIVGQADTSRKVWCVVSQSVTNGVHTISRPTQYKSGLDHASGVSGSACVGEQVAWQRCTCCVVKLRGGHW